MKFLNRAGLAPSPETVASTVATLGRRCVEEAMDTFLWNPAGLAYDNFHLTTSIFVEQKPGAPQKVQTGTFGILYKLFNARFEDMKMGPIRERFMKSDGLSLVDTMPTNDQLTAVYHHFLIHIIRVLPKYVSGFQTQYDEKHPLLQHSPRRQLPYDHKTEFFPLMLSQTAEDTVSSNLRLHEEFFKTQLGLNAEQLSVFAHPEIHDLLTISRIRSAQLHRRKEKSAWERRETFQLGIGLFHLCMNLIWALLHVYRGEVKQHGSLSFFFSILEKKRLGNEKPDYHTLLTSLMQILDGLLLYAWKRECGHRSLPEFANQKPSPDTLLTMAKNILSKYQVHTPSPTNDANSTDSDSSTETTPDTDTIFHNTCKLIRDLLYVSELVSAISDGDIGRVEDLFPSLTRIFRGAGSNNYSLEILHFIHSVKKVWTPAFA
jgi:hypothetical protein